MQQVIIHNGIDYTDILLEFIRYKYRSGKICHYTINRALGKFYLFSAFDENNRLSMYYFKYSEVDKYKRNKNLNILLDE